MAQKIRLVGLDLDGTLLNGNKQITEMTRKAVEEVIARGVAVVPTTGRTLAGIPETVKALPGISRCVTANGAGIYDLTTGQCLQETCMPEETVTDILRLAKPYPIMIDVFVRGKGWLENGREAYVDQVGFAEEIRAYIWRTHGWTPDLIAFVTKEHQPVQKITMNFPKEAMADREELLRKLNELESVAVVCGGGRNLEVTSQDATKGKALAWIGEEMGIRPEEILAIGDSENDLAMIQMAGVGIAMANAEDCVQAAADDVTASNEEDGVAKALHKYILDSEEKEESTAGEFFRMILGPEERLFHPWIFAVLTAVWAYAARVLFLSKLVPLAVPLFGVSVSTRVLREWYLIALFLNLLFFLCLTPGYLSGPSLLMLAAFPVCLYGAARLFCLGGIGTGIVLVLLAAALVYGGCMVSRKKKEGCFRLQLAVFAALLLASLIYLGSQWVTRREEAKPLMDRGQTEYLMERNWEVLKPFDQETFSSLTEEERLEAMNALAAWEAVYLGLEPVTVVSEEFADADKTSVVLGTYQNAGRRIRVNDTVLANGDRDTCLNVLCHELYHAYQWALAEGSVGDGIAKLEQVERWQNALAGYKSTDVSEYREYYVQDAETTARNYAKLRGEELAKMADCLAGK